MKNLLMRLKLKYIVEKVRSVTRFVTLAKDDLRINKLGQLFPLKPTVLNLLVNDICNSRCKTCSIWERKRECELAPAELKQILSDPLFDHLRYVGVSGGEPTLRTDLDQIFEVICDKQPKLAGAGIITNAIRSDQVIAQAERVADICLKRNLAFNLMISLDGIGLAHDSVRGREGNFEAATKVIQHFQNRQEVPVTIGFTASKENAWEADNVLRFCLKQNIYARFRIAEYIDRLGNDKSDVIRNFSAEEAYNLALFFFKLEHQYEKSEDIKRTYRNIRQMLAGSPRSIGCQWQATALTLDSKGHLLYCAPKSPVLESCLETSAQKIYKTNLDKRRSILRENCADCIHDYHAGVPSLSEILAKRQDSKIHKQLAIEKALKVARGVTPVKPRSIAPKKILILGWYGTETAGDKAILWSIVRRVKNRAPGARINIVSLYPFVTEWSVKELELAGIEVIPTYSLQFLNECKTAEEIIMGGGPLMHIQELGMVLHAFAIAAKAGHVTRIEGCGIGPVSGEPYERAVKEIARLASVVNLRDSDSVRWVKQHCGRTDAMNIGDPAVEYVESWQSQRGPSDERPFLGCYLREWPYDYRGNLTLEQFDQTRQEFEQELGRLIKAVCGRLKLRPKLMPMHHFVVGSDDRDFNRRFAEEHLNGLDPIVEQRPVSPASILETMETAPLNICMRFHSVLFASTLGRPFIAIDYTNGGKIKSFLADKAALDFMIDLETIAQGRWKQTVDMILEKNRYCLS